MAPYKNEGSERLLHRAAQFEPTVIELMGIFPGIGNFLLWKEKVLAYQPHGDPLDNALHLLALAKAGRVTPFFHPTAGLIINVV